MSCKPNVLPDSILSLSNCGDGRARAAVAKARQSAIICFISPKIPNFKDENQGSGRVEGLVGPKAKNMEE